MLSSTDDCQHAEPDVLLCPQCRHLCACHYTLPLFALSEVGRMALTVPIPAWSPWSSLHWKHGRYPSYADMGGIPKMERHIWSASNSQYRTVADLANQALPYFDSISSARTSLFSTLGRRYRTSLRNALQYIQTGKTLVMLSRRVS